MKFLLRKYKFGDEIEINRLYKIMTGIDRDTNKWSWEWLNTWNGLGEIYLLFNNEKLIAQYSLIPTPFCLGEKIYVAGKTENCMCHPDYKNKKIYFPLEKKYFEQAKKRFEIFFTTAGGVSNWAAAAVRKKLGYKPLDSWAVNYFCLNSTSLEKQLLTQLKKNNFNRGLVKIIAFVLKLYCSLWMASKNKKLKAEIYDEKKVDLEKIEDFWNKNKQHYGVTIERSKEYLDWRIVQNPHFKYKFLLSKNGGLLNGYLIFHSCKDYLLHIDDVVVEQKNTKILKALIKDVISYTVQNKMQGIICRTLKGNSFLRKQLYLQGFVDLRWYAYYQDVIKNKKQFLVYTDKDIPMDKSKWYITNLATEGRE